MSDLESIVGLLNDEPFGLPLRLADFATRSGTDLLQIVDIVLSSIDPTRMNGGAVTNARGSTFLDERWLDSVVSLLTILGYPVPSADQQPQQQQEWMSALAQGDKSIVYPVLLFCLRDHDRLQQRAYLSEFLLPITMPADLSGADAAADARMLLSRYADLQEEFKSTHRQHAALQKECSDDDRLRDEVHQMEREKHHLLDRIDAIRDRVSQSKTMSDAAFQLMLEAVTATRKNQEEGQRLSDRLQAATQKLDIAAKNHDRLERRVMALRNHLPVDGVGYVEDDAILEGLQNEAHDLAISVRSDMILDHHIAKERLERLEKREKDWATKEDDVRLAQDRIAQLQDRSKMLEDKIQKKKDRNRNDSCPSIFETSASEAAANLKQKKGLLEAKRRDVARLQAVIKDIDQLANNTAESSLSDGESSSSFRDRMQAYDNAKRHISKMKAENASLRQTEQLISNRIAHVEDHIRQKDRADGAEGRFDSILALEATGKASDELDDAKGSTMEDISAIVSRFANVVSEKKGTLKPQMDLLNEKKARFRAFQEDYQEKKERYGRLSQSFADDRRGLEEQVDCLQKEAGKIQKSYEEMKTLNENVKVDLKDLEKFSLEDYVAQLEQNDSELQHLQQEKKKLLEKQAACTEQRESFSRLERLLRLKAAMPVPAPELDD